MAKTKRSKTEQELDGSFLDIDENELDAEWLGQPKLRFSYSLKLAEAQHAFDEAKANLKLVEAEVEMDARESPEDYNLTKVTDASVKAAVLTSDRYKKAQKGLNDAQYRVNILWAAVNSIDDRRKALEKLVDLWQGSYFGEPRASASAREVVDEMKKRSTRKRGTRKE